MANATASTESAETARDPLLTWTVSVVASAYFAWTGISLFYSVGAFARMFESMGAEMHGITLLVLGSYRLLIPLVFGGAAAFVIAKQFFVRRKWINVSSTLAAALVVELLSTGIVRVLYRPLFDLMDKVNK